MHRNVNLIAESVLARFHGSARHAVGTVLPDFRLPVICAAQQLRYDTW
jgi:hypothetical protein